MHVSTYILLYDAGIPDEIVLALSLLVACCLLHKGGLRKPKVCRYVNPLYDLMSCILALTGCSGLLHHEPAQRT